MQPCLLMFDLDGTLIDSREDLATAVNLTRADLGLPALPMERVAGFVGDGAKKLLERSLRGESADIDALAPRFYQHYREHLCDATTLYPGVAEGLACLKEKGFLLALISNKPSEFCQTTLRHFGLHDLFSGVLGGDDTVRLKPHPQPIFQTLEKLGVPASNAWMIGDHRTDLEAARHARVHSGFVTYGIGTAAPEKPEQTWNTFTELTTFFIKEKGDAQ